MFFNLISHSFAQGGAIAGALTALGKDQTYKLGRRLKKKYFTLLHLNANFDPREVLLVFHFWYDLRVSKKHYMAQCCVKTCDIYTVLIIFRRTPQM